jgi:capsular exopolysaccharide synthesis family protein
MVRELETPEGERASPVRITVTAPPELPSTPSFPDIPANTVLGAILGLLLFGVIAVVRDRLDTTVKTEEIATALTGAPVIGHVPVSAELSSGRPAPPTSTSPAAEAVRVVRTNLAFLDVDRPPRTILVTSSVAGEGKTTLSVNLAVALAHAGNRVTLVEADLRRPRVVRSLDLVDGIGLTHVLTGTASVDDVVQPVDGGLRVLGAGPLPPNPSELLASEAMSALVAELAATSDVVVIDAPPLLPVADAVALAGSVDGVLLCARWGSVDADELQRSAELVRRIGARLLGLVMTQVPAKMAVAAYGYLPDDRWVGRRGRGRWGRRSRAVAAARALEPGARAVPAGTRPTRGAAGTSGWAPAPLADSGRR